MKLSTKLTLVVVTVFSLSAGVQADGDKVLTDELGMTLYTFDKDSRNESVCYGHCAEKWSPFIAEFSDKVKAGWGMTVRKDGVKQWTYNNQPLYTWIGDRNVGDTTGDGVSGVWHAAKKSKSSGYKKSSSYSSLDY